MNRNCNDGVLDGQKRYLEKKNSVSKSIKASGKKA